MDTCWTLVNPLTSDKPGSLGIWTLFGFLLDTRWTLYFDLFQSFLNY